MLSLECHKDRLGLQACLQTCLQASGIPFGAYCNPLQPLSVLHHLEFNAIAVVEIETPPGFVVSVVEGLESCI